MAFRLHLIRQFFDSRVPRIAGIALSLICGMSIDVWQFETRAGVSSDDVVVVPPALLPIPREILGTIGAISTRFSQDCL